MFIDNTTNDLNATANNAFNADSKASDVNSTFTPFNPNRLKSQHWYRNYLINNVGSSVNQPMDYVKRREVTPNIGHDTKPSIGLASNVSGHNSVIDLQKYGKGSSAVNNGSALAHIGNGLFGSRGGIQQNSVSQLDIIDDTQRDLIGTEEES